jgi:coenzyme F420-dependent glucose-6-phosphate dehydrogenase
MCAMAKIGYAAMLEQFHPSDLLEWCPQAEEAGFEAGFMVSEHFHPWTPRQGQAAFAWSFMGALGVKTSLRFGTAVTFPGVRYHPAVIAHAAATLGAMFPGRFWLGLGAGEALNEHILGGEWPEIGVRSEMLFEGIEVISKLFGGTVVKHRGKHFKLESARLYTRPEEPVPIYVATSGPINAKRTGKYAQGMITVGAADEKIKLLWMECDSGCVEAGKDPTRLPKLLQLHLSWARSEEEALQNAMTEWPNGGMPFPKQDVRNPEDFAAMAKLVRPEDFTNRVLISSDLEWHVAHIQHYLDMGFDEIHLHNVGRNQAEFIEVFGREVLPNLRLTGLEDATPMAPETTPDTTRDTAPEAAPAGR